MTHWLPLHWVTGRWKPWKSPKRCFQRRTVRWVFLKKLLRISDCPINGAFEPQCPANFCWLMGALLDDNPWCGIHDRMTCSSHNILHFQPDLGHARCRTSIWREIFPRRTDHTDHLPLSRSPFDHRWLSGRCQLASLPSAREPSVAVSQLGSWTWWQCPRRGLAKRLAERNYKWRPRVSWLGGWLHIIFLKI